MLWEIWYVWAKNSVSTFPSPLSAPSLLASVRTAFEPIPDHRRKAGVRISLTDALMSGLAVFGLKYSSLLEFDSHREEVAIRHNLKTLYGVDKAPCDSQMRTILDGVDPAGVGSAFVAVNRIAESQGVLKKYEYLEGYFLASIDGTGHFGSGHISCPQCCVKTHRNASREYYHQLLAAVVVHPDYKTVIPLVPEAILKGDGEAKNDCERNAAKRLLPKIKEAYPNLRLIIVEDSLSSHGQHLNLLKSLDYHFIIGVKPGDHAALFQQVDERYFRGEVEEFDEVDKTGMTWGYRYVSGLGLNNSHPDLKVNFLEYWESRGESPQIWSWITDFELSKSLAEPIMRGGRARWKVENETFNTLKHQEYHLEHSYGHGEKNLATVFGLFTFLAFLLDQLQEWGCSLFQQARRVRRTRISLWETMRALMTWFLVASWEALWQSIIFKRPVMGSVSIVNTS